MTAAVRFPDISVKLGANPAPVSFPKKTGMSMSTPYAGRIALPQKERVLSASGQEGRKGPEMWSAGFMPDRRILVAFCGGN
jgi:hypothetical protein